MTLDAALPRVAFADGHRLVAEALGALVSGVALVVGTATDGASLLALVESSHPSIVVTDDTLPGLTGVEVARRLRSRRLSEVRVIVLRGTADAAVVRTAWEAGVSGVVTRGASAAELRAAIITVAAGGRHLSPLPSSHVADASSAGTSALTDREREILVLVAQGLTAEAIGRQLGISARTVNFHKRNLRTSLGVTTTVEAVAWLTRQGGRPSAADGTPSRGRG